MINFKITSDYILLKIYEFLTIHYEKILLYLYLIVGLLFIYFVYYFIKNKTVSIAKLIFLLGLLTIHFILTAMKPAINKAKLIDFEIRNKINSITIICNKNKLISDYKIIINKNQCIIKDLKDKKEFSCKSCNIVPNE